VTGEMNMRIQTRILVISGIIAPAAVVALPGAGEARKLTDINVIRNMEYGIEQGYVTSKSPRGDYFAISRRTMFVVEYKAFNIATVFYSLEGKPITFNDMKVGDYVLVYGGALKDDTRAAKEVFIIPGPLTGEKRKAFLKEKKLKPWYK
jgi:hypothetical protein